VTRGGEVSAAVEGDACFILRLVSLGGDKLRESRTAQGVPVEVGCLDETETLWFGRRDEYEVRGDELVGLNANDVTDADIFPFSRFEGRGRSEYLGDACVELRVGLMSFLAEDEGQSKQRGRD